MKHEIITCDICNPAGIIRPLPGAPEWRGVFDGHSHAAFDAGWRWRGRKSICPDCFKERADETINPQGWGCYGVGGTPEAPKICFGGKCYAKREADRHRSQCDLCNQFIPHWHPERLEKPLHWKKDRKIFWQSMGDLFHPCTPDWQIEAVLNVAEETPQHTHIFLTKNPTHLVAFNHRIKDCNAWVGTTVTNQADDWRIVELLQVDAPVRFVSHEPLLGATGVSEGLPGPERLLGPIPHPFFKQKYRYIDWAIIGAMTGSGAVKPKPEWVQGLLDQYRAAGVPVFLKDNLHWPEKIQEWPK